MFNIPNKAAHTRYVKEIKGDTNIHKISVTSALMARTKNAKSFEHKTAMGTYSE